MWVSSLEINNIKSFKSSGTIRLDKKMNILLGANNSGKSTILRMLYLMQNSSILTSQDVRIGSSDTRSTITFEEISTNQSLVNMVNQYGVPPTILITGNRMGIPVRTSLNTNDPHTPTYINFPATEPDNFIYPYLSKRKVQGYRREVNRNFVLDVSDTLINLVPKIDRLANPHYTRHAEFEQSCIDILGFPITTFQAADNVGKQIGIIVNDYDSIPLEAMGEGVPNLLGLIVDLCMAEHKLFLVEELENDIHPRALKSLLELIIKKADYNQFVISTHSNIVAKYLGSILGSRIHYISLAPYTSENRIPTAIYKEVGNTPQERREILEDLGYEILDYDLAKGWLFFEESSAESIVKRYLIPWFAPRLANEVKTIACKGTSKVEPKFEDFDRLFLFLHLEPIYRNRVWVIVDGDPSGQQVVDTLKKRYVPSGWAENTFINFSKHNFEEYYPDRFDSDRVRTLENRDAQAKRTAKRELLEKVLAWIDSDPEQAKVEFEKSAGEVITMLKEIETRI